MAGSIASQVVKIERKKQESLRHIWRLATAPVSGFIILILVMTFIFLFIYYVGGVLSEELSAIWSAYFSPVISGVIRFFFHSTLLADILKWGIDDGILAAISVGIPYVLTFYLLMAFLEDSGYLNALAFLVDRLLHNIGLHGRAAIPLISSLGCNVPAIMGTKVLTTIRERVLASILIVITPCSARTAVIMGSVGLILGWKWAALIFGISILLIVICGLSFNKIIGGRSEGMVMEVFPLRLPGIIPVVKKTWYRFREFLLVAAPIVIVGSILLGLLYETGWIWKLITPISPLMEGWLGLPSVAGLTLIFALLRKELALQLLITLAVAKYGQSAHDLLRFMTARQIFVYALVNTIYLPCLATLGVMAHILGWKRALAISIFTLFLAAVVGGLANHILLVAGMN